MARAIKVFQIHFDPAQRRHLDPAFEPLDNRGNPAFLWCEYALMREVFDRGPANHPDDLIGFVSWRFGAKTLLTGRGFLDQVELQPGFDCYYVNPFSQWMHQFQSVWHHGEYWHPGLLGFAQGGFESLGHPDQLIQSIHRSSETAFCNYFVGNPRFWKAFLNFTEPFYRWMDEPGQRDFLERSKEHSRGLTYRSYLMERLFSTFIATSRSAGLRVLALKNGTVPAARELACISALDGWKERLVRDGALRDQFFELHHLGLGQLIDKWLALDRRPPAGLLRRALARLGRGR